MLSLCFRGLNLLHCLSLTGSFGRHIQVALERYVARQMQMRKHDQVRTHSPRLACWMNTQIQSPLGYYMCWTFVTWLNIRSFSFLLGARCLRFCIWDTPTILIYHLECFAENLMALCWIIRDNVRHNALSRSSSHSQGWSSAHYLCSLSCSKILNKVPIQKMFLEDPLYGVNVYLLLPPSIWIILKSVIDWVSGSGFEGENRLNV